MEKNINNNGTKSFPNVSISWYPGHMAKAKRIMTEDLKLIDVALEIVDARIPISSQNPDIKDLITGKKKIIVLNKSDLADEKETKEWIRYFERKGIKAVCVNAVSGLGIEQLIKEIKKIMESSLKERAMKGIIGKKIRVIIVGIPNVGKSLIINKISKKASAEVGNKPGVTKKKQWIRINDEIELLDTPGVLWPKFQSNEVALNLAYTGTIKDEILNKEEISYHLVEFLYNNYNKQFNERYKLDTNKGEELKNTEVILNEIGKKRGALLSGGIVDLTKVADIILNDFRTGKIGKITIEKTCNM